MIGVGSDLEHPHGTRSVSMAGTAHRYGVAVEALAPAVVAKAGGLAGGDPWLRHAARVEWGDLLD
jgi:hypothetical protein